jgi:TRAP-type mannitol/chloroaromatic compound transport system permease small subunit
MNTEEAVVEEIPLAEDNISEKEEKEMDLTKKIDALLEKIGKGTAWLNFVLIGIILIQVILRYVFNRGMVPLEELQWHLYGVGIMVGLSYAVVKDSHIRLDLVYENMSEKNKARFEIFGIIFLLLPFATVGVIKGYELFFASFRVNESSASPTGLPFRWIIKSFVCTGFALLAVSSVTRLIAQIRLLKQLKKGEKK